MPAADGHCSKRLENVTLLAKTNFWKIGAIVHLSYIVQTTFFQKSILSSNTHGATTPYSNCLGVFTRFIRIFAEVITFSEGVALEF